MPSEGGSLCWVYRPVVARSVVVTAEASNVLAVVDVVESTAVAVVVLSAALAAPQLAGQKLHSLPWGMERVDQGWQS